MAELSWSLQFKRMFAGNLDPDYSFKLKTDLDNYLTSPLKYAGMITYCEETDALYYLPKTMTKWEEIKGSGPSGSGIEIVNDYSKLPIVSDYTICYCVNDYVDTIATPNNVYKKGFYLWNNDTINTPIWILIGSNDDEILEWKTGYNYVVGNLVQENGNIYECIKSHTSNVFTDELDNWINKINVYSLTKAQHEYMTDSGLINSDTKDLFIVTDDIGSNNNVDINKTTEENYIKTVTINDIDEDIICERIIETIGSETKEILIAKTPSSDGTSINVGDIVSITKTVGSVIIYEYYVLDDNVIRDPFE